MELGRGNSCPQKKDDRRWIRVWAGSGLRRSWTARTSSALHIRDLTVEAWGCWWKPPHQKTQVQLSNISSYCPETDHVTLPGSELVETLAQSQGICWVHTLPIRTLLLCEHLRLFACSHITSDVRGWFCMCKLAPTGYVRVKWKEARTLEALLRWEGAIDVCWVPLTLLLLFLKL